MDVYFTVRGAPLAELHETATWIDAHGGTGVMAADHLFIGGDVPRQQARRGFDPIVVLSAASTGRGATVSALDPPGCWRMQTKLSRLVSALRVMVCASAIQILPPADSDSHFIGVVRRCVQLEPFGCMLFVD